MSQTYFCRIVSCPRIGAVDALTNRDAVIARSQVVQLADDRYPVLSLKHVKSPLHDPGWTDGSHFYLCSELHVNSARKPAGGSTMAMVWMVLMRMVRVMGSVMVVVSQEVFVLRQLLLRFGLLMLLKVHTMGDLQFLTYRPQLKETQ